MDRRARFLACLIALSATGMGCSDSTGPDGGPDDETYPNGTFSYRFTGPPSGTFSANGSLRVSPSGDPRSGSWALGVGGPGSPLVIFAVQTESQFLADIAFAFFSSAVSTGTLTVNEVCVSFGSCPLLAMMPGVPYPNVPEEPVTPPCVILTGTVTASSVTAERVQGSFSGSGECRTETTEAPYTVANGQFDVALVAELDFDPPTPGGGELVKQ